MADRARIEIGFDGGQALSLLVEAKGIDRLEQALAGGQDTALSLDAEDGTYVIALRKITYLKRFSRASHVGFGEK